MTMVGSRCVVLAGLLAVLLPAAALAQQRSYGPGSVNTHNPNGQTIINNYNYYGTPPPGSGSGDGRRGAMRRIANSWVEGKGDLLARPNMTYGECERMCIEMTACRFMEFAHGDRGCGLFSFVPAIKPNGNADVAIKQ